MSKKRSGGCLFVMRDFDTKKNLTVNLRFQTHDPHDYEDPGLLFRSLISPYTHTHMCVIICVRKSVQIHAYINVCKC